MPWKINTRLYPAATGWVFVDPTTEDRITAGSFVDLVHRVVEYRDRNKLPKGDAVNEVTDFICRNNPNVCKKVDTSKAKPSRATPEARDPGSLGDRVLQWVGKVARDIPRKLSGDRLDTAVRRLDVCRECVHNVDYHATCSGCSKSPLKAAKELAARAPKAATRGVGGCDHFVWDNRLAAQLVFSGPADRAPGGCWRAASAE